MFPDRLTTEETPKCGQQQPTQLGPGLNERVQVKPHTDLSASCGHAQCDQLPHSPVTTPPPTVTEPK